MLLDINTNFPLGLRSSEILSDDTFIALSNYGLSIVIFKTSLHITEVFAIHLFKHVLIALPSAWLLAKDLRVYFLFMDYIYLANFHCRSR